jgi:hypothetical protein
MNTEPERFSDEEITLEGGERTTVSRQGNIVLRETGPWAPSVHALLRHLQNEGFDGAPQVVGSGFDGQGRETLSYIEGEFVHPAPWSDDGLVAVGQMLKSLHDVASSFVPPADAQWQPWFLREIGDSQFVFGHGDAAPWNTVTNGGLPIAFIDWEYAGPVDPLTELARVCWLFAQLHDDDVANRVGLPSPVVRSHQLRLIVDSYGLSRKQRAGFFDRMVEVAIRETANEAIENNIMLESEGPLWGLAWRARAAAWMLRHRPVLERALA